MKVMVLGAKGQLGTDLRLTMQDTDMTCIALAREDVDVTDAEGVLAAARQHEPEVIINTTAFHLVDLCEDEPERTLLVNAGGARNVARAAREVDAVNVYISTDYVFDGEKQKPYDEDDRPNPLSVYGVGKLAAENMTRITGPKHFIVRTTGLYGMSPFRSGRGGNFVETVIKFVKAGKPMKVVTDQVLTPTATADLAPTLVELVKTDAYGLYHMTQTGECSWYRFAKTIAELTGMDHDIGETTAAEFGARANRPAYSVLDNYRMRQAGVAEMRSWHDALVDHMKRRRDEDS